MKAKRFIAFLLSVVFSTAAHSAGSAKEESETLMNAVLPMAEKLLEQHGEFFPFGAAMKPSGEIVDVAGYDGREHPPSADIIKLLESAFAKAAAAKQYKATALVYDVKVTPPSSNKKSDAIAVALDHVDKYSVVVFFPYELVNGKLQLGPVFAQKGAELIFRKAQ
ncbi:MULTISPECIES: hypothetical protein [unclassified Janthinobacterium]|uniref:hypothetical protein n=1 Tax=unclassified Janthinobacterium TaxID=2610881 RepID=UPI001E43ED79|nr:MULTISPECIES: hypothetical protein [unclassified Janthinobacterium]MCC7643613.1 hypothetical protein [Janthinobacterium sp. EB271-G4-3-1]MCC7691419.1 hypothetical protein [Janthinobacterium sp. EB271-G4-3-2]